MIISVVSSTESWENTFTHNERDLFNSQQTTVTNQNNPEMLHKI